MIFTQTVFRKKSIKEKIKYQKLHTTVSRFIYTLFTRCINNKRMTIDDIN